MCGIVGYVGERSALEVVIEGLRRLEYRGYDSAGVALLAGGKLVAEPTYALDLGRLQRLRGVTGECGPCGAFELDIR